MIYLSSHDFGSRNKDVKRLFFSTNLITKQIIFSDLSKLNTTDTNEVINLASKYNIKTEILSKETFFNKSNVNEVYIHEMIQDADIIAFFNKNRLVTFAIDNWGLDLHLMGENKGIISRSKFLSELALARNNFLYRFLCKTHKFLEIGHLSDLDSMSSIPDFSPERFKIGLFFKSPSTFHYKSNKWYGSKKGDRNFEQFRNDIVSTIEALKSFEQVIYLHPNSRDMSYDSNFFKAITSKNIELRLNSHDTQDISLGVGFFSHIAYELNWQNKIWIEILTSTKMPSKNLINLAKNPKLELSLINSSNYLPFFYGTVSKPENLLTEIRNTINLYDINDIQEISRLTFGPKLKFEAKINAIKSFIKSHTIL